MPWWAYAILVVMVAFAAGVSAYAEHVRKSSDRRKED